MSGPPGAKVLGAFGATRPPVVLDGGQGVTWRSGDLVLKPVDDPALHTWVCQAQAGWVDGDRVRVPDPVRADDGAWSAHGWGAHHWLPGRTARAGDDPDRFRSGADDLHRALARLAAPAGLDARQDPWAHGERVAFEGAEPVGAPATLRLLDRARAALAPLDVSSQVVHGDLGGNMLWQDGLPPAVIDWAVYWRPRGWALAVVAMDAVCWEGADPGLLERWSDVPAWGQLLLRAVVYRVATRGCFEVRGAARPGSDGYLADRGRSLDLVLDRMGAS